ncbi:alpha/beta fold hydrolase [Bosea sp. NPDC055332]
MRRFIRLTLRTVVTVLVVAVLVLAGFRIGAAWREANSSVTPPADGRLVAISDGHIFVQQRGPQGGRPVMLVPGTAAWSGFWLDAAEKLGQAGYRAIAVDLPPFGYSLRDPKGNYSRAEQARRLSELIAAMELRDVVLVGHSFGAGPVVETAMRYPQQLRGLAIVSGALGLPEDGAPAQAANPVLEALLRQPVVTEALSAGIVTNPLLTHRLLAMMLHRQEAASEAIVNVLSQPYRRAGTTPAYGAWLPELLLPDRASFSVEAARYRALNLPTAVIWGEKDGVTPLAQGERLHRLLPNASFDVIADVGHIPHIEEPQGFLAVLLRRLREH